MDFLREGIWSGDGGGGGPDMGCIPIVSCPGDATSGSVVTCYIEVWPAPEVSTLIVIKITSEPAGLVPTDIQEFVVKTAGLHQYLFQLAPNLTGTVHFTATIGSASDQRNTRVR